MISESKTGYGLAVREKPSWVKRNSMQPGEVAFFTFMIAAFGCFIGMFLAWIADEVYLGGPGTTGEDMAGFMECVPYVIAPGFIGGLVFFLYNYGLPKYYGKQTYFTNGYHRTAHEQYMSLDPGNRSHAQDAYDALQAFGDPTRTYYDDDADSEYHLMIEADKVWQSTYMKLRAREQAGDLELHQARVESAKQTLETL